LALEETRVALVGCGFVSDYYMATLANWPNLKICSVWDINPDRLKQFCNHYGLQAAESLEDVLSGPASIIVNLTTPEHHFSINMAAIAAGKHVYCEKPLAMAHDELITLVAAAEKAGLTLCAAPANALSQAAEATAKLLRDNAIGAPRVVYVDMEDGPVFRENWREWRSASGAPWPGAHEFEIGCTLEHAGYALTWLIRLFGPVATLSAMSACAYPDKGVAVSHMAADYSVAMLQFDNGIVARLTCGLFAPHSRAMAIYGSDGVLSVDDLWDHSSAIRKGALGGKKSILKRVMTKIERWRGKTNIMRFPELKRVPYAVMAAKVPTYPSQIDFMAGVAAQAEMISGGKPAFFEGCVAAHITEIALAMQAGTQQFRPHFQNAVRTRFAAGESGI
jgi:predicted dehydrogenase